MSSEVWIIREAREIYHNPPMVVALERPKSGNDMSESSEAKKPPNISNKEMFVNIWRLVKLVLRRERRKLVEQICLHRHF